MRLLTVALAASLTCTPLLMIGCAGGGSTSASTTEAAPPPKAFAQPVEIIVKVSGNQMPIESHGVGLLDEDAVDGLGLRAAFAEAGVPVDLSVQSVVLFSLGQQATGGFAADITGLQLKGDTLYVQGTAEAPASGDSATQALTFPYCAVLTPKLPAGLTVLSDITSLQ
ncbi:MAG: protease complex subunit PrcB family protein [Planctomycetota bacterium]